jgi:hypothetical protein
LAFQPLSLAAAGPRRRGWAAVLIQPQAWDAEFGLVGIAQVHSLGTLTLELGRQGGAQVGCYPQAPP